MSGTRTGSAPVEPDLPGSGPVGADAPGLGPTEAAALRSLLAARLLGLLHPDLDAISVAAVRSCARAVDEADTPGARAYAAAVLGRLLRDTGLDPKQTRRVVAGVDREVLAAAVADELAGGGVESCRGPGGPPAPTPGTAVSPVTRDRRAGGRGG
jgi:hypothetical protein